MYIIVIAGLALLGALVHIGLGRQARTAATVLEILVLWTLIFSGISSLFAFIGHVYFGPTTARIIGWPAGNPFQFEVGIANLSIAILALLSIWRRGDFWLATIISISVFMWGAAYGHIVQIIRFDNLAPGNAGPILYVDIFLPIILIGLYVAYKVTAAAQVERIERQRA